MTGHIFRRVVGLLSLCCALGASSTVHAQADVEKRLSSMNKHAMSDYDSLEFEMSRKTLLDAVGIIRQSGLDDSPIAAKTYLNLGVVYVAGFKDRNRGIQQFVQALKINPNVKLDPSVASPDLDEVFAAAKKQVGTSAPTPTPKPDPVEQPEPTQAPDYVRGLQHTPVDEARPGEPLTIKAQLGPDANASRVFVLYRASGQADYTPIAMKNTGGIDWVATIPADAFEDRPLQYYLEARDKKGRAVVGSGSAPNPYIVTISEVAPGARIVHDEDTTKPRDDQAAKVHKVFVFVMPGFGFGYHPGGNTTEVAWQLKTVNGGASKYQRASVDSPGGVALSPFHLAVELGGMVTRHFSLSVVGRFELVTGANAQTNGTEDGTPPMGATTKSAGAVAGFVRARYRFLEGKFHPYIHLDIGGGEIRDALNLSAAENKTLAHDVGRLVDEATATAYNSAASGSAVNLQTVCPDTGSCYDSLKLGYVFVGGGVGLWYDVWKYIGLMLDVNVLGAIGVGPGGQSGMHVDVQLGVGAHFL